LVEDYDESKNHNNYKCKDKQPYTEIDPVYIILQPLCDEIITYWKRENGCVSPEESPKQDSIY